MTRLADVLAFAGVPERITKPASERYITVRLNCGGAVERTIKAGKEPVQFTGYRVSSGQFIYSRIDARNGAFATIPSSLDGAVVSKDFPIFNIRSDRVHDRYLANFFRSGRLEGEIRARSKGATNRQRIKEDEFLSFRLELPPLPEQRRIAAVLDHADALRAKRRQVLAHLDTLPQAILRQSFLGTWPTTKLDRVATTSSGGTPSRSQAQNYGGSTPWVKSGELKSGVIYQTEESLTQVGLDSSSAKVLPPGTVLIAMYGATAGVVAQLGVRAATNQAICAISPGPELNAQYLIEVLRSMSALILDRRSGGAQPNLSQSTLRNLDIALPPIERQEDFASRVSAIGAAQDTARRTLRAADELFTALQSRAFQGEL